MVKNIGKPCAEKPHARFDEGGLAEAVKGRLVRHRQTKGSETDRQHLKPPESALYSTQDLLKETSGHCSIQLSRRQREGAR